TRYLAKPWPPGGKSTAAGRSSPSSTSHRNELPAGPPRSFHAPSGSLRLVARSCLLPRASCPPKAALHAVEGRMGVAAHGFRADPPGPKARGTLRFALSRACDLSGRLGPICAFRTGTGASRPRLLGGSGTL